MAANTNETRRRLSVFFPFSKPSQPIPVRPDVSPAPPPAPMLPYRVRDDLLSPAEFSFFKILSAAVGPRCIVQSKVRLADIFVVSGLIGGDYYDYFNQISAKHLDFLVCDAMTMKPLVGIELDGSSSAQDDRQPRDRFVDQVFEDAAFPLLRMEVQRQYSTIEIVEKISPFLIMECEAAPGQSQVSAQDNGNPLCQETKLMPVRAAA